MKIAIDMSIFIAPSQAYGNITGNLLLPFPPSTGNWISFLFPVNAGVKPIVIREFNHVKVKNVIFTPKNESLFELDDVVVINESDAKKLVTYLIDGFGLFFDEY